MLTNLANYPAADSPRWTYSKSSAKLEATPTVLQKRVFKKIGVFPFCAKNLMRYAINSAVIDIIRLYRDWKRTRKNIHACCGLGSVNSPYIVCY